MIVQAFHVLTFFTALCVLTTSIGHIMLNEDCKVWKSSHYGSESAVFAFMAYFALILSGFLILMMPFIYWGKFGYGPRGWSIYKVEGYDDLVSKAGYGGR